MPEIILRLKPVPSDDDAADLPLDPPDESPAVIVATLTADQAALANLTMVWLDASGARVSASDSHTAHVRLVAVRSPGAFGPFAFTDDLLVLKPGRPERIDFLVTPGDWSAVIGQSNPPTGATQCMLVLWGWD